MIAGVDAFEQKGSIEAVRMKILSLCSGSNEHDIKATFHEIVNESIEIDETDLYKAFEEIILDCPNTSRKVILMNANKLLSSFYVKKLYAKAQNPIQKLGAADACDISLARLSLLDLKRVFQADLGRLSRLLLLPALRTEDFEEIIKSCRDSLFQPANKPMVSQWFQSLHIIWTKRKEFRSCLENILAQTEKPAEFELLCLLFTFRQSNSKVYDLWSGVLGKTSDLGKLVKSIECLGIKWDYAMAHSLKVFSLSLIEFKEYDDTFALFMGLFMKICRSFSRTEFITELLVLAAESENLKYLQYLNLLLDIPGDDSMSLSLNDFKTALDFVEFVPPGIVLNFYKVMVKIGLKMSRRPNDQVINELTLIIRKQLSSMNVAVCLNGVAGALALITAKAPSSQAAFDFEFASCSQSAVKASSHISIDFKQGKEFLQLAYAASMRFSSVAPFFFDNLTQAVLADELSSELAECLNERLAEDFTSIFISDIEADVPEDGEIRFNLMDDAELVVIRIYPIITDSAKSVALAMIPMHLSLLGLLESKLNGGNLENIDAILRFPLILPARTVDDQLCFASSLVAYNLFRAMINVFGGQTDLVIQENCRKRLAHLTELEHDLTELMRKLPNISALKHSAGRNYVCPNSIQVVQKSCRVVSEEATTLLSKAAEYSNDRIYGDARVISAVKVKSELDLFPYYLPLEEHALEWVWNGIDSDQKGKDHSKLLEEEFMALLHEIQLQCCKFPGKLPALAKIVDGTLEAFMAHHSTIKEDSDIIQRFTEFLMAVLAKLKEANLFDAGRAAKVREIIELLVDNETCDLSSLKLKLLMTVSVAEQQEIVKDLTLMISEQNDIATLSMVLPDIKLFKAPLTPLYDPVFKRYADKPSDSQLQKIALAICMAELAKSTNIQSDTWAMQQFDLISNMTKTSYTADIADTFMKAAKDAINLIIVNVMPRLEALLLEDKDTVLAVLKRFQIFTRNVQVLCNHVKSSKDKGLLKRIPPLKKSLEVSLLRVKQMLQANNCIGAFWVGNLKHKGLDGKEVESQIPLKRDVVDDEEDETAACDTNIPSEVEEEEMAEESDDDPTLAISL